MNPNVVQSQLYKTRWAKVMNSLFPLFTRKIPVIGRILWLIWILPSVACANSSEPPKEQSFASTNGKCVFRSSPMDFEKLVSDPNHGMGKCVGRLLKQDQEGHTRLLWERPLINNVAPVNAFVSDSGKYVVTVGEWDELWFLPMVVYGRFGKLINVYGNPDQLTSSRDFISPKHLNQNPYNWIYNTLFFFGPHDDSFIMRLPNGKVVVLETASGELLSDERWKHRLGVHEDQRKKDGELMARINALIVEKCLALAASRDSIERKLGADVLGQYRDQESISILRHALKDQYCRDIKTPQGALREYPVRKVAKNALEALGEHIPQNIVLEEHLKEHSSKP